MSQENVELMQRAIEAFNRGDLPGFRETFCAEPLIVPLRAALETETLFAGPQAVDEFWAAIQEQWADMHIDIESIEAVGGQIIAMAIYSGRTRISAVPFAQRIGIVAEYEGGKASEVRTYLKPRDALDFAGACRSQAASRLRSTI